MTLYFAWIDAHESFDPALHAREDEDIFSFDLLHREAEFPQVVVTLVRPKAGLLSLGRKRRALISYQDNDQVVLLFDGYVVSMPTAVGSESATLELTTETARSAVELYEKLQALKQAPYWDPLFVREEKHNEVEEVLDGRSLLPHWPRTGGALEFSDILQGKETVVFGSDFVQESLKISIKHIPLSAVHMEVTAEWIQYYDGLTDISSKINNHFSESVVTTFTGKHLEKHWWDSGKPILHTPYFIAHSDLVPLPSLSLAGPAEASFLTPQKYEAKLVVGWTYRQKRVETLKLTLRHDCQPLLSAYDNTPGRAKTLKIRLQNIGLDRTTRLWESQSFYKKDTFVLYGPTLYRCLEDHLSSGDFYEDESKWVKEPTTLSALPDISASSFFTTNRGEQAALHALEVARAYLAASARALEISFEAPFDQICSLSCDHMVLLQDERLPGGKALGKVISYSLKMDGETGQKIGHVTIGCAIGKAPSQDISFEGLKSSPSGILYEPFHMQSPRFGIADPKSLGPDHIVHKITVLNPPEEQHTYVLKSHQEGIPEPIPPTHIRLQLMDLGSYDALHHTINVQVPYGFCPPQHVDLSAPAQRE